MKTCSEWFLKSARTASSQAGANANKRGKRREETTGIAEHSAVLMETRREASKILISENSNPKGRNSKEKREPKDPSDLELKTIVQPFSFFQKPILFLELFYQSSGKL